MTHDAPDLPAASAESLAPVSSSIDWSRSNLTPDLVAALARAQATIDTVGKTALQKEKDYLYATSDVVVGAVRRAFAPQGLALVTMFSHRKPEATSTKVPDSNDRIDWIVRVDWVVMHAHATRPAIRTADGVELDESYPGSGVGLLVGWAETVAIGGKGRPPDKSLYAARTSLAGYVALGVSAADRAVPPKSEDIEARRDAGSDEREEARRVRREIDVAMATIRESRRAAGLRELQPNRLVELVYGAPFRPGRESYIELLDRAEACVDSMESAVEEWRRAEDPGPE